MYFERSSGSSHLITLMLIFMLLTVLAVGLIIFVTKWDQRVENVTNDSVNLTGITYNGETYNATNDMMHKIAMSGPMFPLIVVIFLLLIIFAIVALALRR